MKQLKLSVFAFALTLGAYAQVGVNTTTPQTTLDIIAQNPTGTTTNVDGILLPKVDRERMQSMESVPTGTIVYCDNIATGTASGTTVNVTQAGYYFYNATQWDVLVEKGLPTGGTTGQVLAKINDINYNTQWVNTASVETNKEWAGNETIQFNEIRRILMCSAVVTMVNITAGTRTTAATFTTTEAQNWRYIGQSTVSTIAYPANAIVLNGVQWRSIIDGRVWRRSAVAGQVGATQNTTEMANWQAVTEVSRTWAAGAWIERGQIFDAVIGGNAALIRYINSTGKLATNITGDAANYETISTYNIGEWVANTGYPKHHVVSFEGSNYKRLTGGTSAATFAQDWGNWMLMDGDIKPWQPSIRLRDGQIVSYVMGGVTVYLRNANNRVTASSFTLAEAQNLRYISQDRIPITYPASQVVVNGFKFSLGQGGNVYRFNNGTWQTGASFPDTNSVQYVIEGSGAGIMYSGAPASPISPYTMSIAKSGIGNFIFYEDAEMSFAINSSNRFALSSKTSQGVAVWGVEDDVLAAQALLTSTNAPGFVGSYATAGQQPANTYVVRGNVQITTDYDDFGVYHVAPAISGSFYRITIHGAGANRNYVIERWRMGGVAANSKVTLNY